MEERNESGYSEGRKHTLRSRELMIGNFVKQKYDDKQIEIVNGAMIHNAHMFYGIPLTEEWLIKFGFENKGHGSSDNIYYKQEEFLNWGHRVIMSDIAIVLQHGFMNQWSELASLKYVHQLQNLYYSLCFEELTI